MSSGRVRVRTAADAGCSRRSNERGQAVDQPLVSAVGELPVANHIGIKEAERERTAALRDYYIHYV